ncbi:MAG: hypothetical protein JSS76_18980 [Bacteroidetes bacterium]|nr:hypothetical protein [Bacteroidota bacterium]
MATANFNLFIKISDKAFIGNTSFVGKRVQLWIQRNGYSELLSESLTDGKADVTFAFTQTYDVTIPTPTIGVKIFDGTNELPYVFGESNSATAVLSATNTSLTAIMDLKDTYLGITNERIRCTGILSDEEGNPYSKIQIKIALQKGEDIIQDLGESSSNTMGFFSFSFTDNRSVTTALKSVSGCNIIFNFYTAENDSLGSYILHITKDTDFDSLFFIKVSLSVPSGFTSIGIDTLSNKIELNLSTQLRAYLVEHSINTLKDIRLRGGLRNIPDLQQEPYKSDADAISKLDSHGQLETISDNYLGNAYIISQGFTSVHRISVAGREAFASAVVNHDTISDYDALRYFNIATSHTKLYTGIYTALKMEARNPINPSSINGILTLIEEKCSCSDCNAAVSPIAYLSDLLWYATNHLKLTISPSTAHIYGFTNGLVTLTNLPEMFCQDFCLSADQCDTINDVLCQYRIAIEVLQCYKHNVLADASTPCQELQFDIDERNYLLSAYYTLLEQMGTTFSQVRSVYNNGDIKVKDDLAYNLGLTGLLPAPILTPNNRTAIHSSEALYIDPNDSGITNSALSIYLERVFGLRNYTQDCTYSQPVPYIQEWMQEFLVNQWQSFDNNTDVFSLYNRLVLDPDTVTRDNFRFPYHDTRILSGVNYDPNIPYGIWRNRKLFIERFWSEVLEGNHTPEGVEKGDRVVKISGDLSSELTVGKRIRLVNQKSVYGDQTFTIERSFYSSTDKVTNLTVSEVLPDFSFFTGSSCYIEFSEAVKIKEFSNLTSNTVSLSVEGNLVLGPNANLEIREGGANDGFYKSISTLPVVSGTTTNIILTNATFDLNEDNGLLCFNRILPITIDFEIVSITADRITLRGNVGVQANSNIEIKNSLVTSGASNNGIYTVDTYGALYDVVNDLTTIGLVGGAVLNTNISGGNFGAVNVLTPSMPLLVSQAAILSVIQPSTIVVNGTLSLAVDSLIEIRGSLGTDGITSNDRMYRVASVSNSGGQTQIVVLDTTLQVDGTVSTGLAQNGQLCIFSASVNISSVANNPATVIVPNKLLIDPGSVIQILGSTGAANDGIYNTDPAGPSYDPDTNTTQILLLGAVLNSSLATNGSVSMLPSSIPTSYSISSMSGTDIVIGGGVAFTNGDRIEVWGTSSNDGSYTISTSLFDPGNNQTTITITGASFTSVSSGNLFCISSLGYEASPSYVRIFGVYDSEISGNLNVYLREADKNNGKYSILQPSSAAITAISGTPDMPGGYTQIALSGQIPVTSSIGSVSYLSQTLNVNNVEPALGNRTLFASDAYVSKLIASGSSTINVPSIGRTYSIASSSLAGTITTVKVNEALTGQEKGRYFHVIISGVNISGGVFTLNGDLTEMSALAVKIGTTIYQAAVSLSGSDTQMDIGAAVSDPNAVVEVLYDVLITGVDISNIKFTIPTPLSQGHVDVLALLSASPRMIVIDNLSSTNPNSQIEYTITSVSSPYLSGGVNLIDIFVSEPILDANIIASAKIKYNEKIVPVAYSRPKLQSIFDVMKSAVSSAWVSYAPVQGLTVDTNPPNLNILKFISPVDLYPWSTWDSNGWGSSDIKAFITLRDILLANTDATVVNQALDVLVSQLNLTQDAFVALANICEQYLNDVTPNADLPYPYAGAKTVTPQQFEEVFNILIAALKTKAFDTWIGEERDAANNVKLNNHDFWISLTEPTVGNNEIEISNDTVVVDPQLRGLDSLPDMPSAESNAVNVWNKRSGQLQQLKKSFAALRQTYGIDMLLQVGLARVSPFDSLDFNWATLNSDLQSVNPTVSASAQSFVTNSLNISLADFVSLYQIRSMIKQGSVPSSDQYNQVYQILVRAYKQNILYQDWIKEDDVFFETQVQSNYTNRVLFYDWLASKAKLPKWRTSIEDWVIWYNALDSRNRTPIIDPDVTFPVDFIDLGGSAFGLWVSRTSLLATDYAVIQSDLSSTTSSTITQKFSSLLLMDDRIGGFDLLGDMQDAGLDIRPTLLQIGLTYPLYNRLVDLSAVNWSQLLSSEQEELVNIFVQVKKDRDYYALWNDQETGAQITLSGTYFKTKAPDYNQSNTGFYETLPIRRASWTGRRNWEKQLKGREEQWADTPVRCANIVSETEKKVLRSIRDALVMFCGDEYATLNDNAKKLENRFLVDFSMTCCQETTRIASAIDLLQKLIFNTNLGVENQIVIATDPSTVTATFSFSGVVDFDTDWQWLGSYATWRAAMFVFMYPQNLLDPTLRYYQSPGFENMVSNVTGSNRFLPTDACEAAQAYAKYFEDVCNLKLQATAYVQVTQQRDICVNSIPGPAQQDMLFSFALSTKTHIAYYQTKNVTLTAGFGGGTPADGATADSDFSAWTSLEGLGHNVTRIIGSSAYKQEEGVRHLYLFAIIREDLQDKLVYLKYDLEGQYWDDSYTELTPPEDCDLSTMLVMQRNDDPLPPKLIVKGLNYQGVFTNRLNPLGKDWQGTWMQVDTHNNGSKIETIHAYGEYNWRGSGTAFTITHLEIIVAKFSGDAGLKYRLTGDDSDDRNSNFGMDDGTWRDLLPLGSDNHSQKATFMGMNIFIWTPAINILYLDSSSNMCQATINPNMSIRSNKIKSDWNATSSNSTLVTTTPSTNAGIPPLLDGPYEDIPLSHTIALANNWPLNYVKRGISQVNNLVFRWTGHSLSEVALENQEITKLQSYLSNVKSAGVYTGIYNSSYLLSGSYYELDPIDYNLGSLLALHERVCLPRLANISGSIFSKGESTPYYWDLWSLVGEVIARFCNDVTNNDDAFHRDFNFFNTICYSKIQSLGNAWSWNQPLNKQYCLQTFLNALPIHCHLWFNTSGDQSDSIFTFLDQRANDDKMYTSLRFSSLSNYSSLVPHHGANTNISYRGFNQFGYTPGVFVALFGHTDGNQQYASWPEQDENSINGTFVAHAVLGQVKFQTLTTSGNANTYKLNPSAPLNQYCISEEFTDSELAIRLNNICLEYIGNNNFYDIQVSREYLREAYYFIPMYLGVQLSQRGYYDAALKWMKTVYNYTTGSNIYIGLNLDTTGNSNDYSRVMQSWLDDPLNPHALARTRDNAYLQYTISNIAQTFISYANAQFSLNTPETVSKAEELYRFAIELLGNDIFKQQPDDCSLTLDQAAQHTICLLNQGGFTEANTYAAVITEIFAAIPAVGISSSQYQAYVDAVQNYLTHNVGTPDFNFAQNMADAWAYIHALDAPPHFSLSAIVEGMHAQSEDINFAVMSLPRAEMSAALVKDKVTLDTIKGMTLITKSSADQIKAPNFSAAWVRDPNQQYQFDFNAAYEQQLIKGGPIRWDQPSYVGGQTVVYNINPQDALNIVSHYPFPYVPNPVMTGSFCVPQDPVYEWLSQSAQLNLFKIRNCMNIAGMKQELSPYAAPTDTTTGLPSIGANGQISIPGINPIQPTIYRYEVIIARAKQIAGMAQQVEAAYLQALQTHDAEYYNLMKAKQDLALSSATVKLKQLQAKVASDQVDLANLQKQKSEVQVEQLDDMINAGYNEFENQMMNLYTQNTELGKRIMALRIAQDTVNVVAGAIQSVFYIGAAVANEFSFKWGDGLGDAALATGSIASSINAGLDIGAQVLSQQQAANQNAIGSFGIQDSQARRVQEWNFQKTMAQQDIQIGTEQVTIAQDGVRVASQETAIATLQQQNSSDTVNYLSTKFTNVELYTWMSGVLGQVYSYFLREATNIAKMAQNQLAFERQETAQRFVQDDYWETPTDNNAIQKPGTNAPDRRGLTGSARLMEDITKLDDYAFQSDKFKMQITKTFSLASLCTIDFQTFKQTGVLNFSTNLDRFDLDYPGHYLRLIKSVKVSVIALIPPTYGIKATLTSSGISRVTIGGNTFQDVVIRRSPEKVALSGTSNATGLFNLQSQDPTFLNPFEDSGVAMNWEFKMPLASNLFDYNSIADVLFTVDYTSLYDSTYENQVINELGQDFQSDCAYSFVSQAPDAFYQWANPSQFGGSRKVRLAVSENAFPANVSDITINQVKVFVVTDPDDQVFNDPTDMSISIDVSGTSTNIASPSTPRMTGGAGFNSKGIVSTQTNGGSLSGFIGKKAAGYWDITISSKLSAAFADGKVRDVVLVITYDGTLPNRK